MNWLVVYTKPRAEKKLADRLAAKEVEVYCPLKTEMKQWSDRKKKVQVPVFSSYLFVRPKDESQRLRILQEPQVVNYVFWLGKPAQISEQEMNEVRGFLENGNGLGVNCFQIGQEVSIDDGLFKGHQGVVRNVTASKLTLELRQMGVQLVMHI